MKKSTKKVKVLKLRNISGFTGRLRHKETGEVKKCDFCSEEDAMWIHETLDGKPVHLCFGCGDH